MNGVLTIAAVGLAFGLGTGAGLALVFTIADAIERRLNRNKFL